MISFQIRDKTLDELDSQDLLYFRKDGTLKRMSIPKWVQRVILHRDRGMLVSCHKGLSGQIIIGEIGNFNHIIPPDVTCKPTKISNF